MAEKIMLQEYLKNELAIDFHGSNHRPYLKKNCKILKDYGHVIPVLAACRTAYSSTFMFVRQKRVCAFVVHAQLPNRWGGFEMLGDDKIRVYSDLQRLTVNTKEKVEDLLAYIKKVNASDFGKGFVVDNIEELLFEEGRVMPKKQYLGEVMVSSYSKSNKRYGYAQGSSRPETIRRNNGDPMPFQLDEKELSTRYMGYGFFLCKNGNIIVYKRYDYSRADTDKNGDSYSQGPGTMVNLSNALAMYKYARDGVVFGVQPSHWSETLNTAEASFVMPDEQYNHLNAQVLCKELDENTRLPRELYWVPKQ